MSGEWDGVAGSMGEHRTTGTRAWCFADGEWCYPQILCGCCDQAGLPDWAVGLNPGDVLAIAERVAARLVDVICEQEESAEILRLQLSMSNVKVIGLRNSEGILFREVDDARRALAEAEAAIDAHRKAAAQVIPCQCVRARRARDDAR